MFGLFGFYVALHSPLRGSIAALLGVEIAGMFLYLRSIIEHQRHCGFSSSNSIDHSGIDRRVGHCHQYDGAPYATRMRQAGARYAYVTASPQSRLIVEAKYDGSRFELVHASVVGVGMLSGTRRYLYRLR
jgi:hypothetical protein